jgi:hypothetical protein
MALVSLVDDHRQWFKSKFGLREDETLRDYSFCSHAILTPEQIFEVPDTTQDQRFFDNPLVTGDPHLAYYAGVPLVDETGLPLGTLCVVNRKPHLLTRKQRAALKALASQVMRRLVLHKQLLQLQQQEELLQPQTAVSPQEESSATLSYCGIELNAGTKTVKRDGKMIWLTPKEFGLLEYLMSNCNTIQSKESIARHVWGLEFDRNTNFINVYINYLRKKIDRGYPRKLIHTKSGFGFMFSCRA